MLPLWPLQQLVFDVDERDVSAAVFALEFADRVRWARELRGWRQVDLAEVSGLSEFTVVNVESGKVWADLHTVGRLAGALQISVS